MNSCFFQCNLVQTFWNDAFSWRQQMIPVRLNLSWEIVTFGLSFKDEKISYVINNLLLLLKFYIHKCKCVKIPPQLVVFKEEFVIYLDTLKMKSPNVRYLYTLLEHFWFHNMRAFYSPTFFLFFPNILYFILNLFCDMVYSVN